MKNIFLSLVMIAAVSGWKLYAAGTKLYCQSEIAKSAETALIAYGQKKAGTAVLETDVFAIQGSPLSSRLYAAGAGAAKEFKTAYQVYPVQGFYRFSKKYFYVVLESYVEFGSCKVLKSVVTEELREYY